MESASSDGRGAITDDTGSGSFFDIRSP
jgi:hypothetical protein